jgi:DNA-binding XRE family transcriptional regulator
VPEYRRTVESGPPTRERADRCDRQEARIRASGTSGSRSTCRHSETFRHRRSRTGSVYKRMCRWRLSGPKPNPDYPLQLRHLGHHLLKRRMDLGLTRKAAAKLIGTNDHSLKHWESAAKSYIRPMFYAGIVRFLGYNPLPEPRTLGEAVRRARLARGWSLARLAVEASVDPATIRRIEENRARLGGRSKRSVCKCLSIE